MANTPLAPAVSLGPWAKRARCAGMDPNWWFPEVGRGGSPEKEFRRAEAVCRFCPVLEDCAEHAVTAPEHRGMWGGMRPGELLHERKRHEPLPIERCRHCGHFYRPPFPSVIHCSLACRHKASLQVSSA